MHESENEVTQPCLTLSDPMDCSPPGFTVHGIFQARVLGWGAIAFSACWGEDLIKEGVSWPGKPFDINCQNVLSCRTPELLTRDDFLNKRVAWWRCNKGLCYEVGGQGTGRTSRISEQRTLLNKQHHHHQQKPEQNCQKQWPIVVVKKHATVEKHIQEYLLNLSDSVVNNLPAMQKIMVPTLGPEDTLEKQMAIHSSILAWEIPWTERTEAMVLGVSKNLTCGKNPCPDFKRCISDHTATWWTTLVKSTENISIVSKLQHFKNQTMHF